MSIQNNIFIGIASHMVKEKLIIKGNEDSIPRINDKIGTREEITNKLIPIGTIKDVIGLISSPYIVVQTNQDFVFKKNESVFWIKKKRKRNFRKKYTKKKSN